MLSANGGNVVVRMKAARDAFLKHAMEKEWNDSTSKNHGEEWAARKAIHIVRFLRKVNIQCISMLVAACIPKEGKCTPEQESLRSILDTQEIEDVLNGRRYKQKWTTKPWKMPAVQVWAQLIEKYEGIQDMSMPTSSYSRSLVL